MYHVVFDDEFYTVPFMREGTIPQNWTYFMQRRSQSGAPDNIDLQDTWFNPDLEEYPRKNPINKPSTATENNNNTLMSLKYVLHAQQSTSSKGVPVSIVIERLASEGVQNTSNLDKVIFAQ